MKLRSACLALLIGTSFSNSAQAALQTIVYGFDQFADQEALTNQLTGLTFSNALVLGASNNAAQFPPNSPPNVVLEAGGPVTINFDQAQFGSVSKFSAFFTYAANVTLSAYGSSNNLLGSVNSLFSSNFVGSGNGSANELLEVSAADIRSVVISSSGVGASGSEEFVFDDATVEAQNIPGALTPEPSQFFPLAVGVAGLFGAVRFLRSNSKRI